MIQLRVSCWNLFGNITGRSCFICLKGLYVFFWINLFVLLHTWLWISVVWTTIYDKMRALFSGWDLAVDISNASINVLFEGAAVGAVSFVTLQLREHGATRQVCLVTYYLCIFLPSPFHYPFLGSPRGTAVTKIPLPPRGTTVSLGVCTTAVDMRVTMHGPHRESLSQNCCGFRIQLMVSGWPLFHRITGVHASPVRGYCMCSSEFSCLWLFILDFRSIIFWAKIF